MTTDLHTALGELLGVRRHRVELTVTHLADLGDLLTQPIRGAQVTLVKGKAATRQRAAVPEMVVVSYPVTAPCRLAQLHDAVMVGEERGGAGGGSGGSRPLIAPNALDLWRDIATAAGMWAVAVKVDRSKYLASTIGPIALGRMARGGLPVPVPWWQQVDPERDADEVFVAAHRRADVVAQAPREEVDLADVRTFRTTGTPPVGRLLRAAATEADRLGYDGMVTTITRLSLRWAEQIDAVLGSPSERPIRGVACPDCEVDQVAEERDGEQFRVPALVLSYGWDDRERRPYRWCRACGSWAWLDIDEAAA